MSLYRAGSLTTVVKRNSNVCIDHAESIPHKARQHNNTSNRHPGNKKEDKFLLKKTVNTNECSQ
jgi:hypothetical protein